MPATVIRLGREWLDGLEYVKGRVIFAVTGNDALREKLATEGDAIDFAASIARQYPELDFQVSLIPVVGSECRWPTTGQHGRIVVHQAVAPDRATDAIAALSG